MMLRLEPSPLPAASTSFAAGKGVGGAFQSGGVLIVAPVSPTGCSTQSAGTAAAAGAGGPGVVPSGGGVPAGVVDGGGAVGRVAGTNFTPIFSAISTEAPGGGCLYVL